MFLKIQEATIPSLLLLVLTFFLGVSAWAQELIKLQPDEVAMVAYGSLMNKKSLEKSLGREYTGPFIDVELEGWQRTWDIAMPNEAFYVETPGGKIIPKNIIYLNIRPNSNMAMTAVLFVIKKSDLVNFNRREWIYDPSELSHSLKGAKVEGGQVLGYVGKKEFLVNPSDKFPNVAVRKTYIETVKSAIREKGGSHLLAFERTTATIPNVVIADKVDPSIDVFGYKKVQDQTKKPHAMSMCLKGLLMTVSH